MCPHVRYVPGCIPQSGSRGPRFDAVLVPKWPLFQGKANCSWVALHFSKEASHSRGQHDVLDG